MKSFFRILVCVCILAIGLVFSCKKDTGTATEVEQTSTSGDGQILVDNTVQPIIEDVIAVFHSVYERANLKQINRTETEIINALIQDSARVAVLPRLLTEQEEAVFKRRNITPHITPFAVDAIAFIANGAAQDTVINLEEVLKVLRGESGEKSLKLVFDNPGSSTIQYLLKIAGVKQAPSQNVFALKTNEEVIKYVHDNPNTIGIVGVNWLVQPPPALADYVENLTVLAVDNVKIDGKEKKYYKPNQSNIATGSYPLTRKLYVLNYSGKQVLGTGFANYIGAHEGQRIILKSGLLPVEIPTREVNVRNEW